MTIFEFFVTYAVCWWMVLFMVLPHQATPPAAPEAGHAPSAPEKPQIGRKMRWATLFAFIPAIALYFIVTSAHAETVHHAGGGCTPVNATMASDVNAEDGYSTKGKKVKPATLDNGNTMLGKGDSVDIPLWVPAGKYANGRRNVDLSDSYIRPGNINVGMDGKTRFNGASIDQNNQVPEGCEPPAAAE